jgi:hypothetical protein
LVRDDGACLEKLMGGRAQQAAQLREEDVTVVPRRTPLVVADVAARALVD